MGRSSVKIRPRPPWYEHKVQLEPRFKVTCPDHDSYVMFIMCLRQCEELPVPDPKEYNRCLEACKNDFGCEMDIIEVVVNEPD